ncbi:MAG: hypothetical protein KJT03_15410 [Verrucomicrobiae bacterium]|nr:hypothetical protein [Verrucomicrobiae bacterium]
MIKKLLALVFLAGLIAILLLAFFYWKFYIQLQPKPFDRSEVYRGVFYESGIWTDSATGSGKYILAEIHLDEPGVSFFIRPFRPQATGKRHYTLMPVDLLRRETDAEVMMNGTLYSPHEWYQSFPGMSVNSLETLVVAGRVSHIDPKTYLLWFDESMNVHLETRSRPTPEALEQAYWGIGMQAFLVNNGELNWGSFLNNDTQTRRTLIGVDPEARILWLMAFENISPAGLGIFAIDKGVKLGGQLDAEEATTLVLGENPRGVPSYTGLRGMRPLACVIGIQAQPITRN